MSSRSWRFTALIGWMGRPTVDQRMWRGTARLHATPLPLRPLPDGYAMRPLLGRIHSLHVGDGGAVYISGRATAEIAEALNDGHLMLGADVGGSTCVESTEGGTTFTDVVVMGAVVIEPHLFPWRETA